MREFPQTAELSELQREICLHISRGVPNKVICDRLIMGLRTVELERHKVARKLAIATDHLPLWCVEHRGELLARCDSLNWQI